MHTTIIYYGVVTLALSQESRQVRNFAEQFARSFANTAPVSQD